MPPKDRIAFSVAPPEEELYMIQGNGRKEIVVRRTGQGHPSWKTLPVLRSIKVEDETYCQGDRIHLHSRDNRQFYGEGPRNSRPGQ
jgi:hypothetical protein